MLARVRAHAHEFRMQTAFMRKQLNSHHVRNNHSCSTQRLTMACYSGAVFTPLFFTIYKWADRLPLSGGRLRMAASKVRSPTRAPCAACSKPQLAPSHSLLQATAFSKPQLALRQQLAPRQQLILSSARQLQQPESISVQALGLRSSREAAHSM